MKVDIPKLRNKLLSGHEKHPWDHHYQVRRCDVKSGLRTVTWTYHPLSNGVPVISGDSQLRDALSNPERYQWSGSGIATVGRVSMIYLTFTTDPYCRDEHWFAKAIERDSDVESEYSLFSLGIAPDYIFIPRGDDFYPAGWNPMAQTQFPA